MLPTKDVIVYHSRPLIVIIASTKGVHAKVNSGVSTQHLATGIVNLEAVAVLLRHCFIAPIDGCVSVGAPSLVIDLEEFVVTLLTRFN